MQKMVIFCPKNPSSATKILQQRKWIKIECFGDTFLPKNPKFTGDVHRLEDPLPCLPLR